MTRGVKGGEKHGRMRLRLCLCHEMMKTREREREKQREREKEREREIERDDGDRLDVIGNRSKTAAGAGFANPLSYLSGCQNGPLTNCHEYEIGVGWLLVHSVSCRYLSR